MDVLRELALQITWDGEAEPSVWAPLGDFFGTAPGVNQYRSLPLGMTEEGWWYCYWYMPFAKERARRAGQRRQDSAQGRPSRSSTRRWRSRSTSWRGSTPSGIATRSCRAEPERAIDWPMLQDRGRGPLLSA